VWLAIKLVTFLKNISIYLPGGKVFNPISPRGCYFRRKTEMKTTVPEEKQLELLLEKLAGNQAFATCRGKFGNLLSIVEDFGETPSAFCRRFDDFTGQARVMGNLLATLKRDGHDYAHDQLGNALKGNHVFPGEVLPVEQTRPVTLVMFDPIKTVAMVKWLTQAYWMSLNAYLDFLDGQGKTGFHNDDFELTKNLFELFPALEGYSRKRRKSGDYEGWDLAKAFDESVTDRFEAPEGASKLRLLRGQWNDHVEWDHSGHSTALGYMVEGDQASVLRKFSRETQKKIGTWQINLPKNQATCAGVCFGIHEESEHGISRKKHPAFTSKGTQSGLGVRFLKDYGFRQKNPEDYAVPHCSSAPSDGKFRFVLSVH
jgi:hypothetical protein